MPRLFSIRVAVMAVVLGLAFVLAYPTLASYLQQQAELTQLRSQVAAARERNDDLQADLARWDDPAYVTAQARERLAFVMPGETAFRVVDPEIVPDTAPVEGAAPSSELDEGLTLPWYATVWDSVQEAGAAGDNEDAPATDAGTPSP
ncbi:FtsB family cell division protein [Cellulomonas soli]|uniref:FtsB family cell division protein n=1 Tax=Cellulomonas soli TaxID=931535 RepID=UPI003F8391C6